MPNKRRDKVGKNQFLYENNTLYRKLYDSYHNTWKNESRLLIHKRELREELNRVKKELYALQIFLSKNTLVSPKKLSSKKDLIYYSLFLISVMITLVGLSIFF